MPPTDTPSYWLMPGETPVGPYRTEEILAQIQAGSCTWTTKACLVGSQIWTPLNQLLTLAPVAAMATGSEPPGAPVANTPPSSSQPARSMFSSEGTKFIIFALAAIMVIYFFWSGAWLSSGMSQQEVCKAFFSAKNITEARKYVTPNLYAAMDMLAAQPDFGSDDNENLELTSERAAPAQVGGGYYVGGRVHFREAGQLTTVEGVFHLIDQSGWKIQDWYLFSVNGQSLEPPVSLAREYEFFRDPQNPAVARRQMTDAKKQAQQWHNTNKLPLLAGVAIAKSGLGKWLAAIIGVVVFGIIGFFNKPQTKPTM